MAMTKSGAVLEKVGISARKASEVGSYLWSKYRMPEQVAMVTAEHIGDGLPIAKATRRYINRGNPGKELRSLKIKHTGKERIDIGNIMPLHEYNEIRAHRLRKKERVPYLGAHNSPRVPLVDHNILTTIYDDTLIPSEYSQHYMSVAKKFRKYMQGIRNLENDVGFSESDVLLHYMRPYGITEFGKGRRLNRHDINRITRNIVEDYKNM